MSQQPRPAWTGGSEEALVPLDRGDEGSELTEHDRASRDRAVPRGGVTAPASGRSTATAADFTAERYLRRESVPPRDGWRRFVYWLSGGRVNFGPGPAEVAERALIARAKGRVAGCRSIAVISRKGGVGKTTTTLMLGFRFNNVIS